MCRLNSSPWALITLLSFVSAEIPQHMAWLGALLLAPVPTPSPWSRATRAPRAAPGSAAQGTLPSQHRLPEGKANKAQHHSWKPPGCSGQRAVLPHGLWEVLALPFFPGLISSPSTHTPAFPVFTPDTEQRAGDLPVCLCEPGSPHTASRLHTQIRKKYWFCWK